MEKIRILVIEDNSDTRRFLDTILSREYDVISTDNPTQGIELARTKNPALIILDIMLPVMSGLEVCELLKQDSHTKQIPIIFLSSRNTVPDITKGLHLGGDDYLTKPFDYKELLARIQARLRDRIAIQQEPKTIVQGALKLVLDTREVYMEKNLIRLTHTEFDILRILLENIHRVVARKELLQLARKPSKKGKALELSNRTIDVHIRSLRKKIPTLSRHIISVYGTGYRFMP